MGSRRSGKAVACQRKLKLISGRVQLTGQRKITSLFPTRAQLLAAAKNSKVLYSQQTLTSIFGTAKENSSAKDSISSQSGGDPMPADHGIEDSDREQAVGSSASARQPSFCPLTSGVSQDSDDAEEAADRVERDSEDERSVSEP
eukprot:TRINITY_DN16435_c0_g1_i1.p1 TRINITY_DN16435_c0_g1~~TRINITY_DN16435_c0_g1_i1.p1  ORF type:complete len:169 (+),score=24.49 TRINITY_DN16435_c0_g1_i1:78-509(+)